MVMVKRKLALAWTAFAMLAGAATVPAVAGEARQPSLEEEAAHYTITTLPTPAGVQFEAGCLHWLPGDRLAAGTRTGDIWIAQNVLGEPAKVQWTLFAEGLHEVLGLAYRDGWLYATQRPEVTRLKDTDGDGRADVFETYANGWGLTSDYHSYAFGSRFDAQGNIWVTLCLNGSFNSLDEYRGWALKIEPGGKIVPVVTGVRSPGGMGFNAAGDVFYSDNQGPWNGACALNPLEPGTFVGHAAPLKWWREKETSLWGERPADPKSGSRKYQEAKRIPQMRLPAVYFPYKKMGQSASGIACDLTTGRFGPFGEQLFVGDQTASTVMRVDLEKVNGRYQGACFPFRAGLGSGSLGLEWGSDGSLFVFGTDRGWGARGGKPFALERINYTGKVPFEIQHMRAMPDGFELTFTEPVDPASASDLASYSLEAYTWIYQESYGSPEVDLSTPKILKAAVSSDGLKIRLTIEGLVEGHCHELHTKGVKSARGALVLHPVAYYTLNSIPK